MKNHQVSEITVCVEKNTVYFQFKDRIVWIRPVMKLEIKFIAPIHKTNCPREAFLSECSKIRFEKWNFDLQIQKSGNYLIYYLLKINKCSITPLWWVATVFGMEPVSRFWINYLCSFTSKLPVHIFSSRSQDDKIGDVDEDDLIRPKKPWFLPFLYIWSAGKDTLTQSFVHHHHKSRSLK